MASSGAGGFVGGVGQNIAANICGGAIGAGCVAAGLATDSNLTSVDNWRSWVAVLGGLIVLAFGGNLLRLAGKAWKRRRIGAASGERIAVLIARLDGDHQHAPKRLEIEAAIRRGLGRAVDITLWPETLAMPDGRDIDGAEAVRRRAQRWLGQTGCDLLVWGM